MTIVMIRLYDALCAVELGADEDIRTQLPPDSVKT